MTSKPIPFSDNYDWPGPFLPRNDFKGLRPSVWIPCHNCGELFARSKSHLGKGNHRGATLRCSPSCKGPKTKKCVICGRQMSNRDRWRTRQTDSKACAFALRQRINYQRGGGLIGIYTRWHDLPLDPSVIWCEVCHRPQHWGGTNRDEALVRIFPKKTDLLNPRYGGNLQAICKYCYHQTPRPYQSWRHANLNKSVDKLQTPVIH